ncbi:MAG: right-handed parallel beta-helix repeat-containing protein [Verrucomicrobiales bacterium]|nr:PDZ domain-containing protein [Verrucomicrobiota bacterium JB025]
MTRPAHPRRLLLHAVLAATLAAPCARAIDFYVATTGNDTHPGTISEPFATLARAKSQVRSVLPSATEAINVWVRAGTYHLDQTLTFDPSDSGRAAVPVLYSAYQDEAVTLSGAIPLNPAWTTHSGDIQVAAVGTGLSFDMLFVNGELQTLARYPDYDPDTVILNGYASDAASASRASRWANPQTGFVRGLHGSRWGGNSYKITGIKSNGDPVLEWVGDNNRGSGLHAEYRMVENLFEELDAPGEWFYDEPNGNLYFHPPAGINPSTATVEAASLEELIRVVGTASGKAGHLTFRKFTFTGTRRTLFTRPYEPMNRSDWRLVRAGAIYLQDAENVTVSDSLFDRTGGNSIFISAYNRDHLITNNEFIDNGATCVNVVGSKSALHAPNEWDDYITDASEIDPVNELGPATDDYPKDITISYNHMQNNGRFEKQTSGVNIAMAESITVSHNTIHGSPRAGLNVCDGAWGGHVFEFNDVFDCVRETGDHGPWNAWGRDRFYSIGGYNHNGADGEIKRPYAFLEAWKTTIIRNNRFHYDEPTGFGIDLDDGASNYEIYNNLLLNTSVKLREGFQRRVYNNIMINRGPDLHVWYDSCRDQLDHNIIVAASAYNPINVGSAAEEASTDFNLFYNGGETVEIDSFGWTAGSDENSLTADPLFTDVNTLDYSVLPESPALALGFTNFPMDQFGKPGAPEPDPIEFVVELPEESDAEPLMGAFAASIYSVGLQSSLGSPDLNGVYFEALPPASWAAGQGFQQGDVIRSLNGTDITTKQSFWLLYHAVEPGAEITASILRNQHIEPFTFIKPTVPEELNDSAGVTYTGDWNHQHNVNSFNDDLQYNRTTGDSFELTFHGTGIEFTSQNNTDMGLVDVFIDGVYDQTVNLHNDTRLHRQTVYHKENLLPGLHTIRTVNTEDKYLILDSFTILWQPPLDGEVSVSTSQLDSPPAVSTTDLAQTHYLSSSATGGDEVGTGGQQHDQLFNGQIGNDDGDVNDSGEVRMSADNTITVTFDTSVNLHGYDITQINTCFGWNTTNGGRSNQGYAVRFEYLDGSISEIPSQHWEPNSPASYWTTVSITDALGGTLASGVKAVTFDITHNANANGVLIGREFDIEGTPTAAPLTGFNAWLELHPSLTDTSPAGDPDNDGIATLLEYVLNGRPDQPDAALLPAPATDGDHITFTFTRLTGSATDTTQRFQFGSDLENWTNLNITPPTAAEVQLAPASGDLQDVTITISRSNASNGRIFGRLAVESP